MESRKGIKRLKQMKEYENYKNIKGKRTAFLNLGCKVNAYETEAMQQMFVKAGAVLVTFEEKADIYLINTCTVTNIADRKSRQMLHRAKHNNPDALVGAIGCYAQAAGKELLMDESVDVVIGTNHKKEIVKIIDQLLQKRFIEKEKKEVFLTETSALTEYESLSLETVTEKTRAYLKVQDGCNQFCSYCIIPYTRGRIRSRSISEVEEEAKRLAMKGYKELVLTGIHLSSYGLEKDTKKEQPLIHLIQVLNEIEGIERIRLGSIEPRIITKEFVEALSSLKKVCPHFHLSLQSGCDKTLKEMNRKYTTKQYRQSCELLRAYWKTPALTTDVIVGFPGETKEEFEETKQFLQEIAFAQMHIFKFSKRKGTPAWKMQNQIPEEIKTQRSQCLMELEKNLKTRFEELFTDQIQDVLWEEAVKFDSNWYMIGHTTRYEKIALLLDKITTAKELRNQISPVLLSKERIKEIRIGLTCKGNNTFTNI